jgi:3-methyladenine DNA glycosylase Tag
MVISQAKHLKLLDEFSLLPIEGFQSGVAWNLVLQPNEKRLLLSVSWK